MGPRQLLADSVVIEPVVISTGRAPDLEASEAGGPCLSAREREVLLALCEGRTANQVAARLMVSPNTVRTHIAHLLKKLDARNSGHAMAKMIVRDASFRHELARLLDAYDSIR